MIDSCWNQRAIRVAIVGSGPSGLYTAEALLKSTIKLSIDIFEQLPTPFGLVRFGVAPDHPNIKKVTKKFERILASKEIAYFGNVTIGNDLSVNELRLHYDIIVFACGALEPRPLNIPGENLPGCHAAIEFVGWLNGHPGYRDAQFDLGHPTLAIIGQGNVALDVARMFGKSVDELKNTDISCHALKILAKSKVRRICIIGRRGPVQTAFSYKELKEVEELNSCCVHIDPRELALNEVSREELQISGNSQNRHIYDLLCSIANRPRNSHKLKRIEFKFLRSPVSIIGQKHVQKLILEKNKLAGSSGCQRPYGTGVKEELECGLIFCSIGHKGKPMEGIPFDEKQGIFTNREGRILCKSTPIPGIYAVGWIQRGSSGLIGNSKQDAVAVAKQIINDLPSLAPCSIPDGEAIRNVLIRRGAKTIDFKDWRTIDQAEKTHGIAVGKPREKFCSLEEMMTAL